MTLLNTDRLFPVEPKVRDLARALYNDKRDLPIISPHSHTDLRWFAENQNLPNPSELFVTPDHYVFRMLHSPGIALEYLGVPRADGGAIEQDPRKIWRLLASNYYLFRGTVRDAIDEGRDTPLLCLAIAAWMFYVRGRDEAGAIIDVRDPLLNELRALTQGANGPEATVSALLNMSAVFPEHLARQLKTPLIAAAKEVWTYGVRGAIERANAITENMSERL